MNNLLYLILGMMLVTYIPRLLPFLILSRLKLPGRLYRFLLLVPYTALGALIIPGVFFATPQMPSASIAGLGFACVYGWFKGGVIIPVLGAVAISFLILSIQAGLII